MTAKPPIRWAWRVIGVGVLAFATIAGIRIYLERRTMSFEDRGFLSRGALIDPVMDEVSEELRAEVDVERLVADVAWMCEPEIGGRVPGTEGSHAVRERLAERMAALGLEPAFGDSWFQEFEVDAPGGDGSDETVRKVGAANIGGKIPGSSGVETIVVLAHYDHIGGGAVHPGADDNASGVVILLEIARIMLEREFEPVHDLVFLLTDADESPYLRTRRMGSVRFVDAGPVRPERIRLGFVLDILGGTPIPGDPDAFFVMGAENSPDLVRLVRSVPQPADHARAELMSVPMVEAVPFQPWALAARSGYFAFRLYERPFLFVTAGTTPTYHTSRDVPELLDYEKMAAETRYLIDMLKRAAVDESPIEYYPGSVDQATDVAQARRIIDLLLARPGKILPDTIARLRQDRERLVEFQRRIDAGDALSQGEYRQLMLVGLRIQCALTKPEDPICTRF